MIDDNQLRAFTFFSANVQKLMPDMPYERHAELFEKAGHFAQLTANDRLHRRWLEAPESTLSPMVDITQPGVIATYHTGPYRLLPMWLAQQGVSITLVVSADVGKSQRDKYDDWYRSIDTEKGSFAMLDAEDPLVIRKMIRALHSGDFLLVYVDGNMGSGSARSRSELIVDFLAHKIRVRTGVADVARLAGVPIYSIRSRFDSAEWPQFDVLPRINPIEPSHDRAAWVAETMRSIYRHLSDAICTDPMQWEGWFYVHGDMVYDESRHVNELFRFYLPFRLQEHYFLLHKDSYRAYHLPEQLYQRLRKIVLK